MAANRSRPAGKKTGEAPTWSEPIRERNKYGEPTGARYVRCRECGVEVLVRGREHATHRPTCSSRGEA